MELKDGLSAFGISKTRERIYSKPKARTKNATKPLIRLEYSVWFAPLEFNQAIRARKMGITNKSDKSLD
jgi:hypothetical protein